MQFIDLKAQQSRIRDRIERRITQVLDDGRYIMGPEVAEFEAALSAFCGARHSITCANGTDALQMALMALGVGAGDAVVCPTFSFAATAEVVPMVGATPIFADCDPRTFNLDPTSLERAIEEAKSLGLTPRAVIAVDLFGLPADYTRIEAIAAAAGCKLICDSAQGFGGVHHGRRSGVIGDITTTSFFPAKPLGCYGDGGALFTQDDEIAEVLKSMRQHGKGTHKYDNTRLGFNSRLDTLQAAILCEKLAIFPDELVARNRIAERYTQALDNLVITPFVPEGFVSSWAQYTVRIEGGGKRERVIEKLAEAGVPTAIYYPLPLHRQTAYREFPTVSGGLEVSEKLAETVLSLPMHPYLSEADQDLVVSALHDSVP